MAAIGEVMRVLQFGDSVFPVGAFSFSNGLEAAIQEDRVRDKETLHGFVLTATHLAATSDGIAVLAAHRAAGMGDLAAIGRADHAVYLRKLNEEMRTMTVRMGGKLVEAGSRVAPGPTLSAWWDQISTGAAAGTYPVGLGVLFAELGLTETDAFAVHQYGVAAMMVSAAIRLMRLHHLDAQAIALAVNATAAEAYEHIRMSTLADMATFAPMTDILAATHTTAHVRMFMN